MHRLCKCDRHSFLSEIISKTIFLIILPWKHIYLLWLLWIFKYYAIIRHDRSFKWIISVKLINISLHYMIIGSILIILVYRSWSTKIFIIECNLRISISPVINKELNKIIKMCRIRHHNYLKINYINISKYMNIQTEDAYYTIVIIVEVTWANLWLRVWQVDQFWGERSSYGCIIYHIQR